MIEIIGGVLGVFGLFQAIMVVGHGSSDVRYRGFQIAGLYLIAAMVALK